MSADRELLELAAKAAGLRIDKSETNGGGRGNTGFDMTGNAVLDWHSDQIWNPLREDGDALRLAVKLSMMIETDLGGWSQAVRMDTNPFECDAAEHNGDPMAATRRAIVLCAAEIARRMT